MAENALFCTENFKNYTMRVWKVYTHFKKWGVRISPYSPHSTPM